MSAPAKVLLLEIWFFVWLPVLGGILIFALGPLGMLLYLGLFAIWCWELYAYSHYRFCRQEEFLHVMQTAAAAQAPVESFLRAYLEDRPHERLFRAGLLFSSFRAITGSTRNAASTPACNRWWTCSKPVSTWTRPSLPSLGWRPDPPPWPSPWVGSTAD
jgi:hypothetical protein